jgi:hypothetical protein
MSDTFGRGAGNYVDWRDHPELRRPTVDGDLRDTATSPVKTGDVVMSEAEKAARKCLAFEQMSANADGTTVNNLSMVPTEEEDNSSASAGSTDSKRHKRGDGTPLALTPTGSAASFEDGRRVQ